MKKTIRYLIVTLTLSMCCALSFSALALEVPESSDQATTEASTKRLVMREVVGYDSTQNTHNWTAKRVASVSGDNRSSGSPMTVTFQYIQSDSIAANFGASITGAVEKDFILAKVSAEASFDVSESRSWSSSYLYGVDKTVAPWSFQAITAYIPTVTTSGSLKIKVYNDSTPHQYRYEYKPVSNAKIPAKNHVHFKAENISARYIPLLESGVDINTVLDRMDAER